MVKAVLCGYYGMGNAGDDALLATLLQLLPDSICPIVLSGNPAQTRDRHQVEARDRKNFGQILPALRQSQVFIWGGGSLVQDATSALSPLYYTTLMLLAQQMGLTTIAWAQGIGPLNRATTRWFAKVSLAGCDAISVRDRRSQALLNVWNLPGSLAPDPVWLLDGEAMPSCLTVPAPRVAVNLRTHASLTPDRLQALTQALITFQTATQTSLVLLPFQASQDLAIAKAIAPQLPGPHQLVQLNHPQQLKGLFREIDFTIAMRLHALIMATAEGCPATALSYDPKVTQLMQDISLPGWELDQLPDAETIAQTWIQQYQSRSRLSPEAVKSLRDRALSHQTMLRQLLL